MKFIDFTSLLDTEPSYLAVLSTFQFDPDYFERQLLRSPALAKARRILIFMDASQWFNLLQQDAQARFLNRRYLVVPVRPSKGVFHPKLNLFVREDGGQIQCGSNNLTRSGCSSNLELLNSLSVDLTDENDEPLRLAQEAHAFFKRACNDAENETGRIAKQWLDDSVASIPWLGTKLKPNNERAVRLVHTYEGSLWDRLVTMLDGDAPKRFLIISPFFDKDAELLKRFHQLWPKCQFELVVQQKTTNLPVAALKNIRSCIALSELRNSTRRLHAKLLAWESPSGVGCLVGSANFTTAAFDARNTETCFLVSDAVGFVSELFDGQFTRRLLPFENFEPGIDLEPLADDADGTTLRLNSALLSDSGNIKVNYQHRLAYKPSSLRLSLRLAGEMRPRAFLDVPNKSSGAVSLIIPEAVLQDAHGTILASLVAETGNKREESSSIWVIQEGRLTHEPSDDRGSSADSKIEASGEGLTEYLEELGKRDGVSAVIEYLRHLNIRFNDCGAGFHLGGKFRLRIRDPFHADNAPDWLLKAKEDTADLAEAIYDFVDRHEKQRLRKHAKHGNINGMENFLDIFTALIRILYVYHARGVVHRLKLIGRLNAYVEIATYGIESAEDGCEGYLSTIGKNLGHSVVLQEVCDELNFVGHVRAAFVLAQRIRYVPGETLRVGNPPKRPCECLPDRRKRLQAAIKRFKLAEPAKADIMKALGEYKMFLPTELAQMEKEIVF